MRTITTLAGLGLAGALLAAGASPAHAQGAVRAGAATAMEITPYAGYMISGHFLDGPLGTSLGSANGPLYGVQLGLKLAPNVSLIGNAGYSSGNLQVGAPIIGGVDVGKSSVLLYDAGLQLELPLSAGGATAVPFVQGGVGGMNYDVSAYSLSTKATNLAWNIGAGVDVPVGRGAGIRLMAKDYIGKFDFQDATGFGGQGQTTHNVALMAGVRVDF